MNVWVSFQLKLALGCCVGQASAQGHRQKGNNIISLQYPVVFHA